MSESDYNELRQISWRRRLTAEEEARLQTYLAVHPAAQTEWEEELALSHHLQQLPEAPLSSNFTALVMQAVEAEATKPERSSPFVAWWQQWAGGVLPKLASVGLLLLVGLGAVFQYVSYQGRVQFAGTLKKVRPVAALPAPEIFQDFEAIQELPVSAVADEELLAALQ